MLLLLLNLLLAPPPSHAAFEANWTGARDLSPPKLLQKEHEGNACRYILLAQGASPLLFCNLASDQDCHEEPGLKVIYFA
jgi:hypothetical protein